MNWHDIYEGLDKLVKGSCCSQDDGSLCTWELLPKIEEALLRHIEFEEKCILPQMNSSKRIKHENDHNKLIDLLSKASWELECGYGDSFRLYVEDLLTALREHHSFDESSITHLYFENQIQPDRHVA